MTRALALVLALVGASCCCDRFGPAPSPSPMPSPTPPSPGPPAVGGCNNIEGAQATCSGFAVMTVNDPTPTPGFVAYRVTVLVESAGSPLGAVEMLFRVPAANAADLEHTYSGHAPTPCV